MVDLRHSWVRFRGLPDDILEDMPEHVRETFYAAREHRFEVELLCGGAKVPPAKRAPRRFVLVADDMGAPSVGGPLQFDLDALADDARLARRLFVLSATEQPELYAATYAAAIEDLIEGHDAAVVVETRPSFAEAWARTLAALQTGQVAGVAPRSSRTQRRLA
jgi:hypothetical protein